MVSLVFSFLDLLDALVNISCNSINIFFYESLDMYIYIYLGEDITSMQALVVQSDGF